jgi:hypothetical protein
MKRLVIHPSGRRPTEKNRVYCDAIVENCGKRTVLRSDLLFVIIYREFVDYGYEDEENRYIGCISMSMDDSGIIRERKEKSWRKTHVHLSTIQRLIHRITLKFLPKHP